MHPKHLALLKQNTIIILLFFIGTIQTSFGQLHWQKVDSLFAPLPASVHVYKTNEKLNGEPFVAYYVSAKLKDKKIQFTTQVSNGNPYTPDQFYQLEKEPLLIVNCSFFSYETGQNLSAVIRNGKQVAYNVPALKGMGPDSMLYYYPTRSALGIDRKRNADVAWIFSSTMYRRPYAFQKAPVIAKGPDPDPSILDLNDIDWKWWEMRTAVGGGPTLMHDGKVWITSGEEQMFVNEENEKHPRTAMGYTRDDRLIILVIQGRTPGIANGATLKEEAEILRTLDCYEALNLSGGGSSCMLINGKETIKPSEKTGQVAVPAVFMIRTSD
ncbi:MAG: phosphodiester glycosidase family protein [Bacteroidetes bacterium]|nr:phosphodiester glycosidase family protein [Bacteroidota bacterium]